MKAHRNSIILTGLIAIAAADAHAQDVMQPFRAEYDVEWRGIGAGLSALELTRLDATTFRYRSSNTAHGLFRLAFPDPITQTSEFSIASGIVVPTRYSADDGSSDTRRDINLRFDWNAMRVTGTAEGKPVDVALKAGTQDSLSVQIELMRELAAGRSPQRFWLMNKDEVTDYEYTREADATLDTPLGKLDTIVYRSQHPGSSRVTRLWFAPKLQYLPVRAEQQRKGKEEFALNIRSVARY